MRRVISIVISLIPIALLLWALLAFAEDMGF